MLMVCQHVLSKNMPSPHWHGPASHWTFLDGSQARHFRVPQPDHLPVADAGALFAQPAVKQSLLPVLIEKHQPQLPSSPHQILVVASRARMCSCSLLRK